LQFLGKLIQYYSNDIPDNQKKIFTRHCIQTINNFLQNPKSFDDYALITSIVYGLNSYLHSNNDIIEEGLFELLNNCLKMFYISYMLYFLFIK